MDNKDQRLLLYIHVPKTAGTTMKTIIQWLYKWNEIFWAKNQQYLHEKVNNLSTQQLQNISIVAGHSPYGMHEYFPHSSYKYFTFLREPIDRTISQYYFISRSPHHPLYPYIVNKGLSLKQLIEKGLFDRFNIQTYWLTGIDKNYFTEGHQSQEVTDTALANIQEDFDFVGLNEYFDEGLILLKRFYNWSTPFYAKKNVTKNRDKPHHFDEATLDLIRERNQMDLAIYKNCQEQFLKQLEMERKKGNGFLEDYETLMKINRKVGKLKPYRLKLLKDSVFKGIYSGITGKAAVDVWP